MIHLIVTVSSNTCSQTYVQMKHSLAHLQDLIPTLAGVIYTSQSLNLVDVLKNALFVHTFGYVYAFDLNSYRLVDYSYIAQNF